MPGRLEGMVFQSPRTTAAWDTQEKRENLGLCQKQPLQALAAEQKCQRARVSTIRKPRPNQIAPVGSSEYLANENSECLPNKSGQAAAHLHQECLGIANNSSQKHRSRLRPLT